MKKVYFISILLLFLTCVLVGCSNDAKSNEKNISVRAYIMEESKEPVKPTVLLEDNSKFTFTYSVLSSYIAMGSYKVDDGNLILETDDGKYKYVFKIEEDSLIFNAAESSKMPSYVNVPDGAIFK